MANKELTDAQVRAMWEKYPGLTVANFNMYDVLVERAEQPVSDDPKYSFVAGMSNEAIDKQFKALAEMARNKARKSSRNKREGFYMGWGRGRHHRTKHKDSQLSAKIWIICIDEYL